MKEVIEVGPPLCPAITCKFHLKGSIESTDESAVNDSTPDIFTDDNDNKDNLNKYIINSVKQEIPDNHDHTILAGMVKFSKLV